MRRRCPLTLLLLACTENPPDEGDSGADTSGPSSNGYHLLVSGQMLLADFEEPGVFEMDESLERVWTAPLEVGTGGFGAARNAAKETLIAWTQLSPEPASGLLIANASGDVVRRYDSEAASAITFPHGVALLGNGDIVVADVWSGNIYQLDPEGTPRWVLSTRVDANPLAPSGLRVFEVEGRLQMVVTLLGEGPLGSGLRYDQVVAWWIDGTEPERAWSFPEEPNSTSALWVHGPQQTADGTLLVSSPGLGQVLHLDASGTLLESAPPNDADFRLGFPRDAVILPDGNLLVIDATELLTVADPFGAFEVIDTKELYFGYSLDLLDCSLGLCIGEQ